MVLHQEEEWLTQDRPRPPTSQRRHKLQRFHPTLCRSVEGMAARSCYSMLDLFRLRSLCSQHFFPRPHYIPDLSAHVGAQFSLKDQLTRSQSFTAKSLFSWSPKSTKSPSLFSMVLPSVALLLSETPEGGYESILENADIQRFIWEHLNDVDRVIHCLGHASATVSALKLFLAAPEVVILGHDLRRPRPRTFQDGQDLHLASVQECHKRARFPWY